MLPIHGDAQPAHLVLDLPARLVFPFPYGFDKFFPAEIVPGNALFTQLPFHDHLGRDTGVIHAGLPQSGMAAHAVVARQDVHDRILERVAHVQAARDIGRWQHDTKRVAIGGGCERARCRPGLVPAFFYLCG